MSRFLALRWPHGDVGAEVRIRHLRERIANDGRVWTTRADTAGWLVIDATRGLDIRSARGPVTEPVLVGRLFGREGLCDGRRR